MKHSKYLMLALPFLLVACDGHDKHGHKDDDHKVVEVELSEDPVEQVDNIAETVEEAVEELTSELEVDEDEDDGEDEEEEEAEVLEDVEDEGTSAPVINPDLNTPAPVSAVGEPAAPTVTGSFSYDTSYGTPKGTTPMTVTFTVADNVINGVTLSGNPQHGTSVGYQQTLESELGALVVGKDLSQVSALPSKVSGSSLTPDAFNQALAQLQAEA